MDESGVINCKSFSETTIRLFIRYLHTETIAWVAVNTEEVLDLLRFAHRYEAKDLFRAVCTQLRQRVFNECQDEYAEIHSLSLIIYQAPLYGANGVASFAAFKLWSSTKSIKALHAAVEHLTKGRAWLEDKVRSPPKALASDGDSGSSDEMGVHTDGKL